MATCDYQSLLRRSMFTSGEIDYKTQNFDIYTEDNKYWATVTLFVNMTREAMFRWILYKYPNSSIVLHDRVKVLPAFANPETEGFYLDNPFTPEEKKADREDYAKRVAELQQGRIRDYDSATSWYARNKERAKAYHKMYQERTREKRKEYYRNKNYNGQHQCAKVVIQNLSDC